MYDVVVAGAGPTGTAAARACAEAGLRTLCIEEHGTIGHPVQCAGLLSMAAFSECRVSSRPILNRVSGARFIPSQGEPLVIDAGEPKACVVDRGVLDREMAEAAAKAGAAFRLKTSVVSVKGTRLVSKGSRGREEIGFSVLIAADGVRSTIARNLGLGHAACLLGGLQAEVRTPADPRFVEIRPHASPEFFGWVIPSGTGRARVGLCGEGDLRQRLADLLRPHEGGVLDMVSGALPLGPLGRTYGSRALVAGDAAGMAKPTSGGGIYTGVRAARHAAAVAAECCRKGSFRDRDLAPYEKLWREDFGRELAVGMALFRVRRELSPAEVDSVIEALRDPDIVREIVEIGDMDRPAALVRRLGTNPRVIRAAGILLAGGLRALIT
ncbi:MAG TPA: NAD(P)/FAD-dependent oxidoreductase [Methanomicrobiales archaeon]|jgi:geranylgeranyl reductase family protein|nr:NAD(P)/FAD-dependent oxidoreductase [Methanomicrobiales archaeon]